MVNTIVLPRNAVNSTITILFNLIHLDVSSIETFSEFQIMCCKVISSDLKMLILVVDHRNSVLGIIGNDYIDDIKFCVYERPESQISKQVTILVELFKSINFSFIRGSRFRSAFLSVTHSWWFILISSILATLGKTSKWFGIEATTFVWRYIHI